jgi:hypothetical protein
MSAISVRSPEIQPNASALFVSARRSVLDRLYPLLAQRDNHVIAGCFGKLASKDEMVVKGLAASLTCSSGRWLGRP